MDRDRLLALISAAEEEKTPEKRVEIATTATAERARVADIAAVVAELHETKPEMMAALSEQDRPKVPDADAEALEGITWHTFNVMRGADDWIADPNDPEPRVLEDGTANPKFPSLPVATVDDVRRALTGRA